MTIAGAAAERAELAGNVPMTARERGGESATPDGGRSRAHADAARPEAGLAPAETGEPRPGGADRGRASAAWRRIATAVVAIPILVALLLGAPAALFHALVILFSAACVWELGRMFELAGRARAGWLPVVVGAGVTASFLVDAGPVNGPVAALAVAVLVTLAAPLAAGGAPSTERAMLTLFAVAYVSWLLGHAVLLRELPGGAQLILLLVGVTWAGESAAYAVGSLLGQRKLAPRISPGKTVEGAVAQVIASVGMALLLAPWLVPGWGPARVVGAALLLGVVGQVGDLAESVIKRSVGTKDAGGLLPGHGGVLDRLDGLLFNAPVLFYFVVLSGGAP